MAGIPHNIVQWTTAQLLVKIKMPVHGGNTEFGKNRTLRRGNDPRPAAHTMATDHVLNIFKHQSLETQMMLEW